MNSFPSAQVLGDDTTETTTALIEMDDPPPDKISQAVLGQFPWHVAIVDDTHTLICGGSIITDTHILTSAHCTLKYTIGVLFIYF